ncbi:MAG: MerR family transcriptional regulator [Clostridiales bacterium]|nr:MerR family transcriptional regulator [Clostridiales bacterium]
MEIGKFSKESGLSIDTLRYYDKIGVLVPEKINNRRQYNNDDIAIVHLILKLKTCDFSLDEIRSILDMERIVEESVKDNHLQTLLDLKTTFFQKKMDMGKKMDDMITAAKILDKAITKLDQVMDNQSLIKQIMEAKNGD